MASEREIDIPIRVSAGADEGRCLDLLRMALEAEPGVAEVAINFPRNCLRLRYDPRLVSLKRVEQMARRLGIEVGGRFDHCVLRLKGMRCADCARDLEQKLAEVPGAARVVVSPAAETVSLEYDTRSTNLRTFEQILSRSGYLAQPPPRSRAELREAHARESAERLHMATLTVLCLLTLIIARILEKTGLLPTPFVFAVYAASYLAGGFHSAARAIRDLRAGSPNVDLLMVTAAVGAAAIGEWPEGAMLLFLFSASNTLEQFVLGRTRRAIQALMELSPEEAVVRRDGEERRVPVEELHVGDVVIVRPGERIAADGVIRAGRTSVDQSAMTGESIPVEKEVGDLVFAGTLNQQGAIEVEVTQPARETKLARIIQLVEEAQSEKAQSERLTDWFGRRYTLAVLAGAALTLLVPHVFLQESFEVAFYRAMTVLVAASPCAVVISIPAAILAAITSAARGGVLFKGGAHLERAAAIRAIAFDKTGTLTLGRPRLVELLSAEGATPEEVLALAASAESLSEHPLAGAVVEAARERGLALKPASDLQAIVGQGVRAVVEGRHVFVGKAELFTERGVAIPIALEGAAHKLAEAGKTTLYVGDDAAVLGLIAVADTLRPGAEEAVAELRALGIEKMLILSGDNPHVAEAMGKQLGMEAMGGLLPEDKLRVLRGLRAQHGVVAMMGDGINDAPALVSADLGISLGDTATDIALETADMVLVGDDLARLPYAVALSRQTLRVIRQNLLFAFGMIGVLLTITFFGSLRLPFAVIGHEGSTVLVILNGLRLLAFPRPSAHKG